MAIVAEWGLNADEAGFGIGRVGRPTGRLPLICSAFKARGWILPESALSGPTTTIQRVWGLGSRDSGLGLGLGLGISEIGRPLKHNSFWHQAKQKANKVRTIILI